MADFGLEQKIEGMSVTAYISAQLERIEKAEVNLEKEKIKNSYLKQLNNHSRLRLDAVKFELKRWSLRRKINNKNMCRAGCTALC